MATKSANRPINALTNKEDLMKTFMHIHFRVIHQDLIYLLPTILYNAHVGYKESYIGITVFFLQLAIKFSFFKPGHGPNHSYF